MIPPHLEKLIFEGKARSMSFVAGGGQKSVLKVPKDRWIVIYHFTHFPFMPGTDIGTIEIWLERWTTQMRIFSAKSDTHYVIRNNFTIAVDRAPSPPLLVPGESYQEDVYLIHEDDVSFTFSLGTKIVPTVVAATPSAAPAKPVQVDYGKEGLEGGTGAPPIDVVHNAGTFGGSEFRPLGQRVPPTGGLPTSFDQLTFPVQGILAIDSVEIAETVLSYPVVNVQYVEINQNPINIQPSNN